MSNAKHNNQLDLSIENVPDRTLQILEDNVRNLYKLRDYYFENHSIEESVNKTRIIEEELKKSIELFKKHKDCAEELNRAKYCYLKGYALNILSKYNEEAEELLSNAVKFDPKLVDAWNELGECYWKKDKVNEAATCFKRALSNEKNKVSLRNLSMIARQESAKNAEERFKNIEKGLSLAKEAVQLDTHDGLSWSVLGNAHLSSFFGISQNPKTLKQGLSAYAQAEKDIVAKSNPDLHYNKGITLKYEEEFELALKCFNKAKQYDPDWDPPRTREKQLLKYLTSINELVRTSGKMKHKKMQQILQSIDSRQLGPYGGGIYTSSTAQTIKLEQIALKELKTGLNEEKVVLGKVVCSVHNEDTVPFTFCLVDKLGTCVAVTVYNLADGKGVIIGDSVAIPEPYITDVNFKYKDNEFKFRLIRVETPLVLVVNGKKVNRDLQAGVQLSIFKKYD